MSEPIKKILILMTLFITLTSLSTLSFSVNLVAESAIVINGETGQVLYEKNAHQPMYPASTTKVLTAIIVLEDLALDEMVTITHEATRAGGSHIALEPDEVVSVETLLYALMITSANDAAVALAKHHSGTVEAFAQVMNERAETMGALNSHFKNPHGMPDREHTTSAYDLAMISKHAMQNAKFREIVATRRYEIPPTNKKTETRYLNSTNSLFTGIPGSNTTIQVDGQPTPTAFEFSNGIKRGYTNDAQFCFIGSATIENRTVITTVLKSSDAAMYQDTRELMHFAYNKTTPHVLKNLGDTIAQIPINNKRQTVVDAISEHAIVVDLPLEVDPSQVEEKITLNPSIELPIQKDEHLGTAGYYLEGQLLFQTDLVAIDDYSGENLLSQEITLYPQKPFFLLDKNMWLRFASRLFIGLVMWRTVMTFLRIKKIA